jgi:hypothetical protein
MASKPGGSPTGLWGPDDGRPSRPVLRAAGGETPPPTRPASGTQQSHPPCAQNCHSAWLHISAERQRLSCFYVTVVPFDPS